MRLEIPCITTREQWEFGAKAARDLLRGAKSDLPSTLQMFAAANRSLVEAALRGKAESAQSQALTAGAFNLAVGLKYDWHIGGAAQSESQELAVFPELAMLARLKNIEDSDPYWRSASEKAEKMTPHCSAPINLALCQQELTKLQLLLMENGIWDERAMTGGGITNAQANRDPRFLASALVRMRAETAQASELKSRREADPGYEARVISETYPTQWETLVESTPSVYIKIDGGAHTAIGSLDAVIQPSCMLDVECAVRRAEVDDRLKSIPTETMKNGGCYKVTLARFDGGQTGHTWIEVSADHCKYTIN